ncbi:hypothetical protein ABZ942_27925 [Nocardia sp. NPDC046473]|uniref:hypothetical protein n=1 Tax=Nocardia sp. NPDC046473 TaxID=3155733 RepID=UPI0033DBDECD
MDEIVMAAGTALAAAATTDGWAMIKAAVVGWWQRIHPEEAAQIGTDLEQLRSEVAEAQANNDTATQDALVAEWRLRLRRLVNSNPEVHSELRRLLEDEITPALNAQDQQHVRSLVQHTRVIGSNNTTSVAGRDIHHYGGPATPSAS